MIYKYNDFLLESNEKTFKLLNSLSTILFSRFKSLKKEDRFIYLFYIAKYFNINKVLFISKIEYSEDYRDVKNLYLIFKNFAYDGIKFYDKNNLIKREKITKDTYSEFTFKNDLDFLKKVVDYNKEKSQLNSDDMKNIVNFIIDFSKNL